MKQKLIKALMYSKKNWKTDWGNLVIIIFPIIASLIPLFMHNKIWLICIEIIILVIILVGWIHTNYKKESMEDLHQKLYKAEYEKEHLINDLQSIPQEVIKHLFLHWNLTYKDRITIYRYNGNGFIPVGRFSMSAELRKQGRSEYPKDEGFISKSWNNGYFYIGDLPEYEGNEKNYIDHISEISGMKKSTLRNITMKSRSYFCKNLRNNNSEDIAVIVIESLDPQLPIDIEKINNDLDGFCGKVLVSTIETNLPAGRGGE